MMSFVRWSLALCLLLFVSASAFSQSRNTGEIRGTVSAAGAVVPGVTVTLTNIDTGETKDFVTNQDGIYDTVSTPRETTPSASRPRDSRSWCAVPSRCRWT